MPTETPPLQAAAPTHLLVTVETCRVAKAFLLAFMEEVLQGQALVVDIKSTVVTAVCFQPLGGPELGEAGVTADAVNHVPIADLVLDLQRHHCCDSSNHHAASFQCSCTTTSTALGITGTKTLGSAILEAGGDSEWLPLPKVRKAASRAQWQEAVSFKARKSLGVSPSQLRG